MPIPDPFSGPPFPGGYTLRSRYPPGPSAHDEPAAVRHPLPLPVTPSYSPPGRASRSAFAHPLCLGVHGIYKHHSASVDSLAPSASLPSFSLELLASLSSSTLPLSLTLNKKKNSVLLITRDLWDSAAPPPPHSGCDSFLVYLYAYFLTLVPIYIVSFISHFFLASISLFFFTCFYSCYLLICKLFAYAYVSSLRARKGSASRLQ